jgi:hypothetical protein
LPLQRAPRVCWAEAGGEEVHPVAGPDRAKERGEGMAGEMTISEGLGWLRTMRERQAELIRLRDSNARSERRHLGIGGDKTVEVKPEYDVKALDKQITVLAKEIRLLDDALKRTNATVRISDFTKNEDVLGELG